MARVADAVLLELEEKLLVCVDQAWEAYEQQEGGYPPPMLTELIIKAHKTIAEGHKRRLGGMFDPNNPEQSLLELERMAAALTRQIQQKHRLRTAS